jgi:hypothetical protein
MNEHDRKNLEFLLGADQDTMQDWYSKVSEDDVEYALELLQLANTELMLKEIELEETQQDLDLSQAQALLSQFTLN